MTKHKPAPKKPDTKPPRETTIDVPGHGPRPMLPQPEDDLPLDEFTMGERKASR
jgi:hypothetical protein